MLTNLSGLLVTVDLFECPFGQLSMWSVVEPWRRSLELAFYVTGGVTAEAHEGQIRRLNIALLGTTIFRASGQLTFC